MLSIVLLGILHADIPSQHKDPTHKISIVQKINNTFDEAKFIAGVLHDIHNPEAPATLPGLIQGLRDKLVPAIADEFGKIIKHESTEYQRILHHKREQGQASWLDITKKNLMPIFTQAISLISHHAGHSQMGQDFFIRQYYKLPHDKPVNDWLNETYIMPMLNNIITAIKVNIKNKLPFSSNTTPAQPSQMQETSQEKTWKRHYMDMLMWQAIRDGLWHMLHTAHADDTQDLQSLKRILLNYAKNDKYALVPALEFEKNHPSHTQNKFEDAIKMLEQYPLDKRGITVIQGIFMDLFHIAKLHSNDKDMRVRAKSGRIQQKMDTLHTDKQKRLVRMARQLVNGFVSILAHDHHVRDYLILTMYGETDPSLPKPTKTQLQSLAAGITNPEMKHKILQHLRSISPRLRGFYAELDQAVQEHTVDSQVLKEKLSVHVPHTEKELEKTLEQATEQSSTKASTVAAACVVGATAMIFGAPVALAAGAGYGLYSWWTLKPAAESHS